MQKVSAEHVDWRAVLLKSGIFRDGEKRDEFVATSLVAEESPVWPNCGGANVCVGTVGIFLHVAIICVKFIPTFFGWYQKKIVKLFWFFSVCLFCCRKQGRKKNLIFSSSFCLYVCTFKLSSPPPISPVSRLLLSLSLSVSKSSLFLFYFSLRYLYIVFHSSSGKSSIFSTFLKCLDHFHSAARFGPIFCCPACFSVAHAWWRDAACVKESVGNWNAQHIFSRFWGHVLVLLGCGVQPPLVAARLACVPKIPWCFGNNGLHSWNLQSTAMIWQPIISDFCHVTHKVIVNVTEQVGKISSSKLLFQRKLSVWIRRSVRVVLSTKRFRCGRLNFIYFFPKNKRRMKFINTAKQKSAKRKTYRKEQEKEQEKKQTGRNQTHLCSSSYSIFIVLKIWCHWESTLPIFLSRFVRDVLRFSFRRRK